MGSIGPLCVTSNGNTLNTVTISGTGDNEISMDRNVICQVGNQGLFTLLSLHSKSTATSTAYRPSRYQYNPGTHAWTNITMSAAYKRNVSSDTLCTVNGSSSTLMHIYKGNQFTLSSEIAVSSEYRVPNFIPHQFHLRNVLGPLCVASNGVTLYVVASSGSGDNETIILAQSNGAPTSLANLSWTIIATTPQKTLSTPPGLAMDGQVGCFVSSQGVFTLLSVSTKPPEYNEILNSPAGFQYNPATKIWISVDVSSDYGWRVVGRDALFEVEKDGSSALIHAFKTNRNSETTSTAVFNTGLHTMVEGHATRALPASSGSLGQYAATSYNLFVTSYNVSRGTVYVNVENPALNGSLAAYPEPSLLTTLNVKNVCDLKDSNFKTVVRRATYYLFCGNSDRTSFRWFTYDGNQSLTHSLDKLARTTAYGFLPLGPAGGAVTWAFMYDTLGVYGVTLMGPEVGA
ncbi:hypothetical protein BG006_001848 [Podila minutissima]|uniref:Uncharacterized protein n=1 Tax=Podila minutissima TaxID=64525 RepID=A0A9P5VGT5_9FUNG|nr:hypothetical protein BG006_001848 [Podila minutissima]